MFLLVYKQQVTLLSYTGFPCLFLACSLLSGLDSSIKIFYSFLLASQRKHPLERKLSLKEKYKNKKINKFLNECSVFSHLKILYKA